MRLIGPNCRGVMAPHTGLNATFAQTMAKPGRVAFVSQSGALLTAVLDRALTENIGFSAVISLGSMLDIGWGPDLMLPHAVPHRATSIFRLGLARRRGSQTL